MNYKIAVVTSSRADYGILKPLLNKILQDQNFTPQLIVAGTHLDKKFGYTVTEIEKDNFAIADKIKINLKETSADAINQNIGNHVTSFSKSFSKLNPNLIILLGDRFEIFSAAIAAYVLQIPIAHIHGGEISSGAFDEGFRHSITKLSTLHFTITEEYRNRVIQLGEVPKTVFNVGALAVDNINQIKLLSKRELEREINFSFGDTSALLTYHPVTLEKNTSIKHLQSLFKALDKFPKMSLVFNKSNADTGGMELNKAIEKYVSKRKNAILIDSLGMKKFLSTLNVVDMMIGNSSAGLIEMPNFKKPTVNIGDRQKGRFKPTSVIDCDTSVESIVAGIEKALDKQFIAKCSEMKKPYGDGNAANQILKIIKEKIKTLNLKKEFHDLK